MVFFSSRAGRPLLALPLWHVELAKVHALVALGDRDDVAATDVSSVLDRFVVAQFFDFVVDVVEYLTEARPSKTRTGTLKVITSYSKFRFIYENKC